ncbi:MAG: 2-C-methyl-D-erythritol 4-phosphate cytidylyltransferase [Acidimicrobiales bacterium]|nr:2-C-methyl-D-erythritol 4-phosphate cytidylyltransferase [Acidimicrobiales bacterium]
MSITWAVVVAGGRGTRFGQTPKQFHSLNGKSVLNWSLSTAKAACDGLIVVLPEDLLEQKSEELFELGADYLVSGGDSRSESVRSGIKTLPKEVEFVLVHDAARPMASINLWRRVRSAIEDAAVNTHGIVPGISVIDTIKEVDGDSVLRTLDRSKHVLIQTPQGFRRKTLDLVHSSQAEATDDAALLEAENFNVKVIDGEMTNVKITYAKDLALLKWQMDQSIDYGN